jgi:DNA polymerase-3 subunit alpha
LLDSTTDFNLYIQKAVELGQKAICFTEHGNTRGWVAKKMACDAAGIKYLHGIEMYLTESLEPKVRDNYHTILIAKNRQGFLELNRLISMSTDDAHKYYVGRISFEEFLKISQNIIKITACLASPLNKIPISNQWYEKLAQHYDYFEIQPHNCEDQINYNRHLAALAQKYGKPLIAGTDAHNVNAYYGECRILLCAAKHKTYGDEDDFDLTYKSREELEHAFAVQDAIPEDLWQSAIDNTVEMAESVEEFELDTSLKYPILYGTPENDREKFIENVETSLKSKVVDGIIPKEQEQAFKDALDEEIRVFSKLGMCGFMQSMSEITTWCHENGIVTGPARGSVGGSRAAYVTDVIDLNPEKWGTVFSRFANEDRVEVGDIDVDVLEEDRPRIFEYIINRFGQRYTAFVPSAGTLKDRGCIDEIVRGLRHRWMTAHEDDPAVIEYERRAKEDKKAFKRISPETAAMDPNPYKLSVADEIKKEFERDPEACKKKYDEIFYYFDGMLDTRVSQSVHPAGIVISPVTLDDNYGTFIKDDQVILQIDMEEIHEVSLVKYDLLALKTLKILRDACEYAGIPYPKTHEVDWDDQAVWEDMLRSPVGIFQMEGEQNCPR